MRLAALLGAAAVSAHAEPVMQAVPASAQIASVAHEDLAPTRVPAGSSVILELVRPISSRTVRQGDSFPIRLAAPILADGRVVAPAGTSGEGQVVDAGRAGALGKPAKLVLAARYLTVDGTRVELRGFRVGAAGRDNSSTIMVASFVPYVGLLAMFAHGGEIDVPAGTLGQAKLVADLPVRVAAPASVTPPPLPVSSQ